MDRFTPPLTFKRHRSAAFLGDDFEGARKYNRELVKVLKRGDLIDNYRLLEELGIDPREADLVKAVSTELENLEAYGLVTFSPGGWWWVG